MNFVGIIAEYDPFHSGHALQLRMLRQRGASTIAVCMSTGVVQRGGVPILPEAVRVRAALAAGADLVVALPAPYANASAEQFAAAGVHLLAALGCDTLAFGAETPEPAPLQAAAAALCSAAFPAALRSQLESGMRQFYQETGVQPYLYLLPNGSVTSTTELTAMAEELYPQLFTDEGHFLLVFCDNGAGSYNCG